MELEYVTFKAHRGQASETLGTEVSRFLTMSKLPWCATTAGMNLFFAVFAMHVAKPHFITP